jgi:transcriptional regulator with XRE-family HTH domain
MDDLSPRDSRALAAAVRQVRAVRMIKQEELAGAAGLGRNFVTTLESGRGTNPRFASLVVIARELGIPLSELVRIYEERLDD